jgi:hypothetical protein
MKVSVDVALDRKEVEDALIAKAREQVGPADQTIGGARIHWDFSDLPDEGVVPIDGVTVSRPRLGLLNLKTGNEPMPARTYTLAGAERRIRPLQPQQHAWFMRHVRAEAARTDRPLQRFIATLEGIEGKDRTDAISAFVAAERPAPDSAVEDTLRTVSAVRLLARLCLVPSPTYEETLEIVDGPAAYAAFCAGMGPPTRDEIHAKNQAFRDRLAKQQEAAKCPAPPPSPTT